MRRGVGVARRAGAWAGRGVEDTGLAPRIVAALKKAGANTCGAWGGRAGALEGAGLPAEDCAWADRVGKVLERALDGCGDAMGFADWLEAMLPERWRAAVRARRELDEEGAGMSLHEAPLEKVGAGLGVTRERARQVLEKARRVLASPLAQWAAAGLYGSARSALAAAGGGLFPAEWAEAAVRAGGLWAGVSATGALLVLHEAAPAAIGIHRELFVSLPPGDLDAMEARLRRAVRQAGTLVPLGTVGGSAGEAETMGRLARRMPDAIALRDGRAGLLERDGPRLLREILLARGPMRLEALAAAFNALVFPECQRGAGKVRQWALEDAALRRLEPGVYGLAEGFQPELFAGG